MAAMAQWLSASAWGRGEVRMLCWQDGEEGGGRTRRKRKKEREAKGRWERGGQARAPGSGLNAWGEGWRFAETDTWSWPRLETI